ESGSTLRFLLPVAAALGKTARFTGEGRLPMRPNDILTDALRAHSVECDASLLPINISGQLRGGTYEIAGNVSSQYITGLLMSLPLCGEDSDIILTTKLESAPYVVMTIEVLKQFGIRIDVHENGWHIPGGQKYHSPESTVAEGDWSSAAFWVTANNIGSKIELTGILDDSSQGDKAIVPFLEQLGGDIDVSETPDLVPTLAVGAAMYNGITRFVGAGRLRIKESDRLTAVKNMLTALGGRAEDTEDTLTVFGGTPLHGGTVDGCNDHRIVMAAAIAATVASGETVITDAQAVSKSYPAFFDHFNAMGGHADVEPDR
ncbi:MAG: 3-phosphoshikimate 1-carboxyvinyltransferase, partial [Clostridia bacterium]|nr:3-phosphoshikimate 1-carboxyvinyltransferase [Clostridia bacterium]